MTTRIALIAGLGWLLWQGCQVRPDGAERYPLPYIGRHTVADNGDTAYHQVPDFSFVNQDSQTVTQADVAGKIYVVDFFFTHCPTICPRMTANLLTVYEHFADNDEVRIFSHSIDPARDTVGRLKAYAEKLGVSAPRWHFLRADQDYTYALADEYYIAASEDPRAPGGFDHSGKIILVDKNRHIRAFCDGTDAEDVARFIEDIEWLSANE